MAARRNQVKHHGKIGEHGPGGGQLYAAMPMQLARDPKLSSYARAVAVYVWSHDERWQQSATAVAEAIGVNRKTVTDALGELQQRGWLAREVHTNPGKSKPAWECWHLQMTNRPWTPAEVEALCGSEGVRHTDIVTGELSAPRTHRCPPHGHIGGHQTDTIEVQLEVHPEVHSRSASTGASVEPAPYGRSLPAEERNNDRPKVALPEPPAERGLSARHHGVPPDDLPAANPALPEGYDPTKDPWSEQFQPIGATTE